MRVSHTGMSEQGRCSQLVLAFFYLSGSFFHLILLLSVWTVLTVRSPVPWREAAVLRRSSRAQHRWLWDLVGILRLIFTMEIILTCKLRFWHSFLFFFCLFVCLFCCLFVLGPTQYSRWRASCPNVHWWSHCSCHQTCSLFSAVTWTNALCISWKATWSKSLFSTHSGARGRYFHNVYAWNIYWMTIDSNFNIHHFNLGLQLDTWLFHLKVVWS